MPFSADKVELVQGMEIFVVVKGEIQCHKIADFYEDRAIWYEKPDEDGYVGCKLGMNIFTKRENAERFLGEKHEE